MQTSFAAVQVFLAGMSIWSVILGAIALALTFGLLRWGSRPGAYILIDPKGNVSVRILPFPLDPERRMLLFLTYAANLRTRIREEVQDSAYITRRFDEVIALLLSEWKSIPDGSLLRSEHVTTWRKNLGPRKIRSYTGILSGSVRQPFVVMAVDRPFSEAATFLQLAEFATATVQSLATHHRPVLERALRCLHQNRHEMPKGRWDNFARVQTAQLCGICYRSAMDALGMEPQIFTAGRSGISLSLLVSRSLFLLSFPVRHLSIFSYVLLWFLGVHRVPSLIGKGAALHAALFVIGGQLSCLSAGLTVRGPFARMSLAGRVLRDDGVRLSNASLLLGVVMAVATYATSWHSTTFEYAIGAGLGWAAAGYACGLVLSQVGVIISEFGFFNTWSGQAHGTASTVDSLKRRMSFSSPRLAISLMLSFSWLCFFLSFSILSLSSMVAFVLVTHINIAAAAITFSLVWTVVFHAAFILAQKLISATAVHFRSESAILVLRRFATGPSEYVRRLVAPTFGSYGRVTIVADESYRRAGNEIGFKQQQLTKLLDSIGGYKDFVTLSDTMWQSNVEQLIIDCDLCVIDVTSVGLGVAWEISTALRRLPTNRVMLVAHYDAAMDSGDLLFDNVLTAVRAEASGDEADELTIRLHSVTAPVLYGDFIASALFKIRVYRRIRRLCETVQNVVGQHA